MVENSWIRATGQLLPDSTSSVDTFHVDYVRAWQGTTGTGVNSMPPAASMKPIVEAYPNPAHGTVCFSVNIPGQDRTATVMIYDMQGRAVRCLTAQHPVWNGDNQAGIPVKAGVYFYRLRLPGNDVCGKFLLLK
jgi:hypothetical protein